MLLNYFDKFWIVLIRTKMPEITHTRYKRMNAVPSEEGCGREEGWTNIMSGMNK